MSADIPPEGALPAEPPAPVVPKIRTLTLSNFRGFPGPAAVPLALNGKSAVIFGENGSGKSSIFQALDGFFSVSETSPSDRRQRLVRARNLYSGLGSEHSWIEVEFDDGQVQRWNSARHPCDIVTGGLPASTRVFEAAYRKAIIDYKLLLETNFRHSAGSINLFEVCVAGVLRDFRTPHGGSEETLRNLWLELQRSISPSRRSWVDPVRREAYRLSFNAGLTSALESLIPTINEILTELGWADLKLESLEFPLLTYNNEWQLRLRGFNGASVRPRLNFNGEEIAYPHLFLNEARLSALALAIYFAGRELCAQTTLADTPKLMVLDDIVVGLDQSNRLPVLDLLAKRFRSWQIVLLTHDRVWFDMTRSYHRRHQADRFWTYWELHPAANLSTPPTPLPMTASAARQALDLGTKFLEQGHLNAAGNAVRIACERSLLEFCEVKNVPVKFRSEREKTAFSELIAGAKEWSNRFANALYNEALADLEMYASSMLNSLSHGGTPALTRYEIQGAITSVRSLLLALKVTSKFEE